MWGRYNLAWSVTCKVEAVIRVRLSVETVRMALLPENCMFVWPKTADTPLHGDWWRKEAQLLYWSVIWLLFVCAFLTLLLLSKDFTEVLSHSLLIASLRTNIEHKHVHSQIQEHRDTFVNMWFGASCDLHVKKEKNHNTSSYCKVNKVGAVVP